MSPAMPFDEATSRRVEATYSTPDVAGQRRTVRAALGLQPGEDVLDIGSGPGFLAREMSGEVGPGGSVTGVDPSENMLSIARARSRPAGPAPGAGGGAAEFRPGEATALPCAAGSFDVVTSTQVYEYVDDVPAALAEAWRVLRPGGRLLVLDTDWDSIVWRSGDDDRMRRVLRAWDGHLADPHLPRRLTGLLGDAGFSVTRRAAIPLLNVGYDPDTYSAGLIEFVSAFVPRRGEITAGEITAWATDLVSLGPAYFFSLNRYLFVGVRG
jgi:arsenite methyltransferase